MSITKRQFNLLQAMGITVWQRRDLPAQLSQSQQEAVENTVDSINTPEVSENQTATAPIVEPNKSQPVSDAINIDLQALLNQQLFRDIIHCLGASRADLSVQGGQIDLGLINWQFSQSDEIEFSHNCLKTPNLNTIANSTALKKALWQSIGLLSST